MVIRISFDIRLSTFVIVAAYPRIRFHRSRFQATFSAGLILEKSGGEEEPLPLFGFAVPEADPDGVVPP